MSGLIEEGLWGWLAKRVLTPFSALLLLKSRYELEFLKMNGSQSGVIVLLRQIESDGRCPMEMARQLESTIIGSFPDADDDERLGDLMHVLASYRPEGGEYMYGSAALVEECKRVLKLLQ
jgi:hypothetical protein